MKLILLRKVVFGSKISGGVYQGKKNGYETKKLVWFHYFFLSQYKSLDRSVMQHGRKDGDAAQWQFLISFG